MTGRAVRYRLHEGERISFHRDLGDYQGRSGSLTFDDGATVRVIVYGGWLDVRS